MRSTIRTIIYGVIMVSTIVSMASIGPHAARGDRQTLRQLLQQLRVPAAGLDVANLDLPIIGVPATDEGKGRLTIACYLGEPDDAHVALDVLAFDRVASRWHQARIAQAAVARGLGSIVDLRATPRYTWIALHNSPSASTTLVFSPALVLRATLDGWIRGTTDDDVLIYERSQIHFAPTHPFELAAYDVAAGRDHLLYPRPPYQPLRIAYLARVRAIYDDVIRKTPEWPKQHNHHLDPTLVDSAFKDPLIIEPHTRRIAFRVTLGDPTTEPPTPREELVVACDLASFPSDPCREARWDEWSLRHQGLDEAAAVLAGARELLTRH
jgi:hypothetical protein